MEDLGNLPSGVSSLGESIIGVLDAGNRQRRPKRGVLDDSDEGSGREYRVRTPTNSERLNRALVELSPSAFKIHLLLWKWRGAPAKGTLPFFTIRSLEKFCRLTRPTIRRCLIELVRKGWIRRLKYDKHHKNALYSLVPVRQVAPPLKERQA